MKLDILNIDDKYRLDIKVNLEELKSNKNDNIENFSKKIVPFDEQFLIKQPVLDNCLLTSLFNAYPKLFNYNIDNLRTEINNKTNTIDRVLTKFPKLMTNEHKKNDIFEKNKKNYIKELKTNIKKCIKNMIPVVLSYYHLKNPESHAISIFGYDFKKYYYFENGLNQVLLLNIFRELYDITKQQISLNYPRSTFRLQKTEWLYDYIINNLYREDSEEFSTDLGKLMYNKYITQFGKLNGIDVKLLNSTLVGGKCIFPKNYNINFSNIDYFLNFDNLIERLNNI